MDDLDQMNNFQLRDELLVRVRRLLKTHGYTEVQEVGEPGVYEWRSEALVGDVNINEDSLHGLTVYRLTPSKTWPYDTTVAYDAYTDGCVRVWDREQAVAVLKTLRSFSILDDLAQIE